MINLRNTFCLALLIAFCVPMNAHINPELWDLRKEREIASARMDCAQASRQLDMSVNNVRARLLNGGDLWWDLDGSGKYIVPKVDPTSGQPEVSSLFAGAVWLGGVDPAGNLKLACQDYRSDTSNDFWPGPLDDEGNTAQEQCSDWDRFFNVTGADVRQHRALFESKRDDGSLYQPEEVPSGIRNWPAFGNPYFEEENGYLLPTASQGLAPFFDQDKDGVYDPTQGDFPIVEIRGCEFDETNAAFFPDDMYFWIYNDNGGIHTATSGDPIRMEVQVQAFAYVSSDEINDMTFLSI